MISPAIEEDDYLDMIGFDYEVLKEFSEQFDQTIMRTAEEACERHLHK